MLHFFFSVKNSSPHMYEGIKDSWETSENCAPLWRLWTTFCHRENVAGGAKGEDPRSATVRSRADREREGGYSVPAELQLDSSNVWRPDSVWGNCWAWDPCAVSIPSSASNSPPPGRRKKEQKLLLSHESTQDINVLLTFSSWKKWDSGMFSS